jgi:glycosyltransferase involved in cell wall biosynthesis
MAIIAHATAYEHEVVVFGEEGPMSDVWRGQGARVRHLGVLQRGHLTFVRAVRRVIEGGSFAGVLVWSGVRVPLVLFLLGEMPCRVVLHGGNPCHRGHRLDLLLRVSERVLPRPRNVTMVCCSEHVRQSFVGAPFFRRLPIEVCLNPIPAPSQNPHVARPLTRGQTTRMGMVARLDAIKDHATVIRAFARLATRWPQLTLHLAGDGPERLKLESLARDLTIATRVEFMGSIADVPQFLETLDVFAYATTAAEGMGNALAEAMARGLPCVVTDLPVMREVVGDDPPTARLVPPGDDVRFASTVETLLLDAEARAALSQATFHRARRVFDAATVTATYLAALRL